MRCPHMQQRVRKLYRKQHAFCFSFHGDSPACEHLTHKILLRYYLFIEIITQSINCNIFSVIIFTNLNAVFCSFYTNGLLFLLENIAANTRKSMNKTAAYTNTITLCSSPASSEMRNYMNTDIPPRSAIIMEVKNVRNM